MSYAVLIMPTSFRRRPTLRDVALAAGVSIKTVSRVVNDEKGVSADLVERVDKAIASLRYLPDERARNLRRFESKPSSIGFALRDVSNPFFSAILRGLEDTARAHGCLVLSGSSDDDPRREQQLIETFLQRRVGGVVVVPCGDDIGPLGSDVFRDIPLVFVDCEPALHHNDVVRTDHFGGARAMTRLLLEHGHCRIGFFGDDPGIFSARLRFDGFALGLEEQGLCVPLEYVVRGSRSPVEWYETMIEVFRASDAPTAILTAQNFVTMGAVRALHELGLQNRIALVGFDDVELSDVVRPGISVLAQQPRELGRRAGELLFRRLAGFTEPPVSVILEGTLIRRGSGEIRPADG